jgi:uncharacterized peroxidase-related enzyme
MTFITPVPEGSANGGTAAMYARAKTAFGYLPNMVKAFSHRPGVMDGWNELLDSIKSNMDARRYELVTIAAAKELGCSYCMLAHGSVLLRDHYDADQLQAIVNEPENCTLNDTDKAIMRFACKVVRDATSTTARDVGDLRKFGLSDAEIFDIASAAAVRCFFSKTLDALGVQPDSRYKDINEGLRQTLEVGRSIED